MFEKGCGCRILRLIPFKKTFLGVTYLKYVKA